MAFYYTQRLLLTLVAVAMRGLKNFDAIGAKVQTSKNTGESTYSLQPAAGIKVAEEAHRISPTLSVSWQVGTSNYSTDWFFVQPVRLVAAGARAPTVWRIDFPLKPSAPALQATRVATAPAAGYVLRVAVAAAQQAALLVAMNDPGFRTPVFDSGVIGQDNALARASAHGDYCELEIHISGSLLQSGMNSLFLKQRRTDYGFAHIMYDYLRLEGPVPGLSLNVPGTKSPGARAPDSGQSRAPPPPVFAPQVPRQAPPGTVTPSASTGARYGAIGLGVWLAMGLVCILAL